MIKEDKAMFAFGENWEKKDDPGHQKNVDTRTVPDLAS